MSDFLNFNVDDEIIDGNPEYNITQKLNGKYEIDLANEIIQDGTSLNKAIFDKLKKINRILGYNSVTSEDLGNDEINLQTENIEINNIENNERILMTSNGIALPAKDFSVSRTTSGLYYGKVIKLASGRKFSIMHESASNASLKAKYTDNDFVNYTEVNLASTLGNNFYNEFDIIELENENILICGMDYDYGKSYYAILNKNGVVVKNPTEIGYSGQQPKLLKLSNGNIMLVNGGANGYAGIFNNNGSLIKSRQYIGNLGNARFEISKYSGNVIIYGLATDTGKNYIKILDGNLNVLLNITTNDGSIRTLNSLSNGEIFMCLENIGSPTYKYYVVYDESGNIVKEKTLLKQNGGEATSVVLNNGNILLALFNTNNQIYVLDSEYNVISTKNGVDGLTPQMQQMENGNIFVSYVLRNSNRYLYCMILDKSGNIVKNTSISNTYTQNTTIFNFGNDDIYVLSNTGLLSIIAFAMGNYTFYFNNVLIDTALQPNKYYELIYNSSLNKFIAEEVRV